MGRREVGKKRSIRSYTSFQWLQFGGFLHLPITAVASIKIYPSLPSLVQLSHTELVGSFHKKTKKKTKKKKNNKKINQQNLKRFPPGSLRVSTLCMYSNFKIFTEVMQSSTFRL